MDKYPHQFSGGQLQRIAIALGLASEPEVMIFDEPTTGLDVTTQADVIAMLGSLIRTHEVAAIYISHDLALLSAISDQLVIFYAGEVVESGRAQSIVKAPRHPYTRALLDALPSVRLAVRPQPLPGLPPGRVVRDYCPFVARCKWRVERCAERHPSLSRLGDGEHQVRCIRQPELGPLESLGQVITASRADTLRNRGSQRILQIENLVCVYRTGGRSIIAVDGTSLSVYPSEVVALVGESGSGKSTIARVVAGILSPSSGTLQWRGRALPNRSEERNRLQRREIQIIFQNPDSSLNPRHTVRELIERPMTLFRDDLHETRRVEAVAAALEEVQLDPGLAMRYPHQLSGGQRQRVAIARAFAARPSLVICDEIVSGQDVSIQAAILELIRTMQQLHQTALLFISHDLAVVRSIAQYVYVAANGRIIEEGPTQSVFEDPRSGYTKKLLEAVIEPVAALDPDESVL
jgi:peptide/nickel transport system ATP-binding protein